MTSGVHWIVGAGGLLGSSVVDSAPRGSRVWFPAERVNWSTPESWGDSFNSAAREMSARSDGDDWSIWWCAGRGTVSSRDEELLDERRALEAMLGAVARCPKRWRERGSLVYSSSAGSVYADTDDVPIRIDSLTASVTAYGRSKLEAEEIVRRSAAEMGMRSIVTRITNLYGPRQDLGKGQGLVSRVCSAIVNRRPIPVFVSLGTVRNYIYASDAARIMWDFVQDESRESSVTRIVCSPANVSVGGVLKMCEMIADERPLVRLEARTNSVDLSRSVYFDPAAVGIGTFPYTPFHVGVHRVFSAMLDVQRAGRLVATGSSN